LVKYDFEKVKEVEKIGRKREKFPKNKIFFWGGEYKKQDENSRGSNKILKTIFFK